MNHSRCPHILIFDMNGTGHMDGIQSAGFQICCDRCAVMYIQTSRNFIIRIDSCQNGDLSFGLFFDFFNDQSGKTHPVFKTSAKFIHTFVGTWGQKRTYKITMCHMDLYGIHTGFHSSFCCFSVTFYQFIHFFGGQFSRNISSTGCRDTGSCCDRCTCILCISFRTCILQLDGNFCTFCVTGVYHVFETFDGRVVIQTRFSWAALGPFVYNRCFDGDQSESTFCTLSVICNRLLAHGSVGVGKVIAHRRNYKTVLYRYRSDLNRLKHCFKFHICSPFLSSVLPAMPLRVLSLYFHKYVLLHTRYLFPGLHR